MLDDPSTDARGQAHTLEGITGALLVLLGLVFALQVTVVTPMATSTANQHVSNQLEGATAGTLAVTEDAGQLRPAVLYWDEANGRFHGSGERGYYGWGATSPGLLDRLATAFVDERVAYNVDVVYVSADGDRDRKTLVRSGAPADDAITVSRSITLYDDDMLWTPDDDPDDDPNDAFRRPTSELGSTSLGESNTFYAPDVREGHVYNVVQVEVTTWQN